MPVPVTLKVVALVNWMFTGAVRFGSLLSMRKPATEVSPAFVAPRCGVAAMPVARRDAEGSTIEKPLVNSEAERSRKRSPADAAPLLRLICNPSTLAGKPAIGSAWPSDRRVADQLVPSYFSS